MTKNKQNEAQTEVTTPDALIPDPRVATEFGISMVGLWRWDRDPAMHELGWPPPVRIRSRKFRSRKQLEQFKANLIQKGIEERSRAVRKRRPTEAQADAA